MANTHSIDLERSSSQSLSIADASQTGLDFDGTDISIEMWVKLEQLPSTAGGQFIFLSKDNSSFAYRVALDTAEILAWSYSSDGSAVFTDVTTDAAAFVGGDVGAWVHIAITCDVSTKDAIIYKNGTEIASTPVLTGGGAASIVNNSEPFYIGCKANGTQFFFDGKIDDVRMWNDVRTEAEIDANMNTELVGNEAGLVAYWKLNDSLLDETSNNNDLTNNGSAVFSADPAFSGVTTSIKTFNGLAYASTKTVNGLAIASVKTWNGLA